LASEALLYLTYLALIFIIGILLNTASNKLRIPNILLLLAFGIFINCLGRKGIIDAPFPGVFISAIIILALVMVAFDASSKFRIKGFNKICWSALKLTVVFLLLNIIFLTFSVKYIFGIDSTILALVFSALMSGTSSAGLLAFMKQPKTKAVELLKMESVLSMPIIILLPFILIGLLSGSQQLFGNTIFQSFPVLGQVIVGIGSGVIIGLVFFKAMRRYYSPSISPIAAMASVMIAYVLAENLGSSGVLAVITLGLFFGNVYIRKKEELQKFSSMFISILEIFIFIMAGIIIFMPFTAEFFIKSLALFIIFLLVRFVSLNITFSKKDFSIREKVFMALVAPKGITEVVVIIVFSALLVPEISVILSLAFAFVIYSIITSIIAVEFSD
jgi:potassium/hydrogen antiporter